MYFAAEGACQYLDPETKLCTIYDQRHEINPSCLRVEQGIELGVFPADCPYVADLPHYVPPAEAELDADTLRLIDAGQITGPGDLEAHLAAQRRKRNDEKAE